MWYTRIAADNVVSRTSTGVGEANKYKVAGYQYLTLTTNQSTAVDAAVVRGH